MTFNEIDLNGDGVVSREELAAMLQNLNEFVSDQEIDDMILKADLNNDGLIQFDEFIYSMSGVFWSPSDPTFHKIW